MGTALEAAVVEDEGMATAAAAAVEEEEGELLGSMECEGDSLRALLAGEGATTAATGALCT